MKAVIVDRYGTPGVVRLGEVPDPVVGERDVLVEVHAAGVNPLDVKIRAGEFKAILPYRTPFLLGHDVAGVVVAVGAGVDRFTVGDEVYARPAKNRIGTFADLIAIDQDDVAVKPASLTMTEAASLPLVALTAWQALVERANVQPGQKVLIHAGAGGVGSLAIQLAHRLGAAVATTVSSRNVDLVQGLGAEVVVDYRQQDFSTVLSGYDTVLDSVGGQNLEKSFQVLRPGGVAVGIAGPPDPAFAREIGANLLVRGAMTALSAKVRRTARRHGVRYTFLFMTADGAQLAQVGELVDAGHLRPIVDRTFGFDEALDALAYVEAGSSQPGKVVVQMR
ncbi:MAG TPA: NADP-dependent oxidoreductase [Microlunatus sp.]